MYINFNFIKLNYGFIIKFLLNIIKKFISLQKLNLASNKNCFFLIKNKICIKNLN